MPDYRIAELIVRMEPTGRTLRQAEPYRLIEQAQADISVASFWDKVKSQYPGLSDDDGNYLASGANFYKQLLNFDGLMLHSSAVVVEGKAYLFSAPSGTGKSTHTSLWLKEFPGAYILNDDKPALRRTESGWIACGTPWSGKHDISVNTSVPVAGIAMVHRSDVNTISRFSGVQAIAELMDQVTKVRAKGSREKMLILLDQLMTEVPVWKLQCNMEPEAAYVSYGAMKREGDRL